MSSVATHRFDTVSRSHLLIAAVQQLSLARTLDEVMSIVRHAARELTGADGATFVLREGASCYYAEEDAISPLWKGQRFPLEACISGWAMVNREPVAIEDIYADARIPHAAYRPTFVHSLVMVPIRTMEPIGAIGNYWAARHLATEEEVALLSALADSTSIAMENVRLYETLERKVEERTAQLAASRAALEEKNQALLRAERQKKELAALIVHDIKSPATSLLLSAQARLRKENLADDERRAWRVVQAGASTIDRLALTLLDTSAAEDGAFTLELSEVDAVRLLEETAQVLEPQAVSRGQRIVVSASLANPRMRADADVLRRVLQNLADNALRHSPAGGTVTLGASDAGSEVVFTVADHGPGIPEEHREKVFERHARLAEPGKAHRGNRGLGLTFARLAATSHGGTIRVEANQPKGSVFVLRLPRG